MQRSVPIIVTRKKLPVVKLGGMTRFFSHFWSFSEYVVTNMRYCDISMCGKTLVARYFIYIRSMIGQGKKVVFRKAITACSLPPRVRTKYFFKEYLDKSIMCFPNCHFLKKYSFDCEPQTRLRPASESFLKHSSIIALSLFLLRHTSALPPAPRATD